MSIQAVILETGEHIITDITEVIDPTENKSLGYKLINPFVVSLDYSSPVTDVPVPGTIPSDVTDAKVNLTPWCPLSSERSFQVEHVFCRVIYKAHGDLEEIYVNTVSQWNDHNQNEVTVDQGRTIVTMAEEDSPFNKGSEAEDSMMRLDSTKMNADGNHDVPMNAEDANHNPPPGYVPEPEDGFRSEGSATWDQGNVHADPNPNQNIVSPTDNVPEEHGDNVIPDVDTSGRN